MAPLAYIFIRLLPQSQIGDGEDDELIVSRYSPTFSKVEYDTLFINDSNANVDNDMTLTKLFSCPLPKNDDTDHQLFTDVYESTLDKERGEQIIDDSQSYKIITLNDLYQITEHDSQVQIDSVTNHILHLYRQHKLDSRVSGRRLLHGTSGSNFDNYTLRPKPKVVFFDCDDCLYFDGWRIAEQLTQNIEQHCQTDFGLPEGYAYILYKQHGTALRGLIEEGYLTKQCSQSIDRFLNEVHDLPIHELLKPDRELRDMLLRMHPSIRKFVFTASVSHHAERCLEALGIADLFEGIIDVKDCQFETKHSLSSFHIAMEKAGIDESEACVFLDDSVKNIEAARSVGWRSVLVGRVGRDCGKTVTSEHAEHEIDRIHQLPEVFPELF